MYKSEQFMGVKAPGFFGVNWDVPGYYWGVLADWWNESDHDHFKIQSIDDIGYVSNVVSWLTPFLLIEKQKQFNTLRITGSIVADAGPVRISIRGFGADGVTDIFNGTLSNNNTLHFDVSKKNLIYVRYSGGYNENSSSIRKSSSVSIQLLEE